jgi:hypothetical protein
LGQSFSVIKKCAYYVLSKEATILSRENQLFSSYPLQVQCGEEIETTEQVHLGDASVKSRVGLVMQLLYSTPPQYNCTQSTGVELFPGSTGKRNRTNYMANAF